MLENITNILDMVSNIASEIITFSELAKEVVDTYNERKNEVEEEIISDNNFDYSKFTGKLPDDKNNGIDVHVGEQNSELKTYLIKNLWSLPQLLLHYGITQKDIDDVIPAFDRAFNKTNNIGLVDSAKLQLIYNDLTDKFSHEDLVNIGVYNHNGLLKVNPVDVLYSKKEKSPAELAELELLKGLDIPDNDIDNEDEALDMYFYTAMTVIANGNVKSEEDIDYLETIMSNLDEGRKTIVFKFLNDKKARM